jgi:NAD(P)-dependent dehydrogenase (short-subunit alcohol dehydrogenase family)
MSTDSVLNELRGQVAIVTGGGRGLGRATVLAVARAGARVGVVARSEEQLAETVRGVREAGGEALAVVADVSDAASVHRMARQVERTLGPVDLLVNNAGTVGPLGPMWEADPGDWWHSIDWMKSSATTFTRFASASWTRKIESRNRRPLR